jgi:hypothetical protein
MTPLTRMHIPPFLLASEDATSLRRQLIPAIHPHVIHHLLHRVHLDLKQAGHLMEQIPTAPITAYHPIDLRSLSRGEINIGAGASPRSETIPLELFRTLEDGQTVHSPRQLDADVRDRHLGPQIESRRADDKARKGISGDDGKSL